MNGENNADMVASWVVNGDTVDALSNIFTIEKLTEKTDVVLIFTAYEGYTIPESGEGYTISDVVRTPDDTTPADEIRKGGDLSFKVTPADGCLITKLVVNGVDRLTTAESGNITVVDNGDCSYTVTITDVSDDITFNAESMQFQIVKNELTAVPDALADTYNSLSALETALRTAVTKVNKSYKNNVLFDIVLQYTTDGGNTWQNATEEHFPAGGIKVTIPYTEIGEKLDNTYTYTVVHMFTTAMNGQKIGDTETLTPTKTETGIEFTVNSLSPFAVGYYKASTTTVPSSGAPTGGVPSGSTTEYTLTVNATVGGKITPSGRVSVEKGDSLTFTMTPDSGYVLKELLIDGVSVGASETYTIESVTRAYTVEAVFDKSGTCTEDTCPMKDFDDLLYTAWYHDAVHYALENGIMVGVKSDKFAPDGSITRGMVVTILWRMAGKPVVNYAMTFEDVAENAWYAEAVRWAASEGIVEGYNKLQFAPNDNITREQLAAILYRYVQYNGGGFTGSWMFLLDFTDREKVSEWAYESVCYMTMHGVINGKSNNILDPKGTATRAEAAQIIKNYLEKIEA